MALAGWILLVTIAVSPTLAEEPINSLIELQQCGGRSNSSLLVLQSPGYPGRYPPRVVCELVVEAASSSVCGLELDLHALPLEPCPSSRLTVGSRPLCGAVLGLVQLPFRHPRTIITFRGNEEGGDSFQIDVRQRECTNTGRDIVCNKEFSGENLIVESPGYPVGYPEDLDCSYVVSPSSEDICQMEVRFIDFNLENSQNCTKDRLLINEDQLCGELSGTRTYNVGSNLVIRFTTDSQVSSKGFKLAIKQMPCAEMINVVAEKIRLNEKLDSIIDCEPHTPPLGVAPGYPNARRPYPPFTLPNTPQQGYLPPNNVFRPFEQRPSMYPPYILGQPIPTQPNFYDFRGDQPSVPQLPYRGPDNVHYFFYGSPNIPRNPVVSFQPNQFPFGSSLGPQSNQCCGHSYVDSHFLLVSPGFPRSTSSDCYYAIRRHSSLTAQIRYQMRYFWVGEDSGMGCTGGYLEIDGSKICGCKTGATWTSNFFESETAKVLHLRLDSSLDRLFNGFIIEVYQEDSYSQRYIRSGEQLSNGQFPVGSTINFTQNVETVVDRIPLLAAEDYRLPQKTSEQLIWDSGRQSWISPTDLFCLRWSFKDFLLLAREALWSQYQCPSSSSQSVVDTSRNEVTQSTACRTCNYFCRQNCNCC